MPYSQTAESDDCRGCPGHVGKSHAKRPYVISGGRGWRGAKLGLTGLKSRPPKERFCCARAAFFSPPCEGGVGGVGQTASASPGVGRRTSASSVCSPFARNDVRKRHALQAGEAAHAPSTSSIGRAQHGSFVHSKLTGPPPLAPPSQGGEKEGALAEVAQRIRKECTSGATPTLHHAVRAPFARGGEKDRALSEFAQRIGKECTSGAIPTPHHPRASLPKQAPAGDVPITRRKLAQELMDLSPVNTVELANADRVLDIGWTTVFLDPAENGCGPHLFCRAEDNRDRESTAPRSSGRHRLRRL